MNTRPHWSLPVLRICAAFVGGVVAVAVPATLLWHLLLERQPGFLIWAFPLCLCLVAGAFVVSVSAARKPHWYFGLGFGLLMAVFLILLLRSIWYDVVFISKFFVVYLVFCIFVGIALGSIGGLLAHLAGRPFLRGRQPARFAFFKPWHLGAAVLVIALLATGIGSEVNASRGQNQTSASSLASPAALIAKRVSPSLVAVEVRVNLSDLGLKHGDEVDAGLVYTADGLILTSADPVESDELKTVTSIRVMLPDKANPGRYKETVPAVLVGVDKTTGIALLRVKKSGLTPAKLSTTNAKVNEWTALISNLAYPSYASHMGTLSYAQATVSDVNDHSSSAPASVITLKPSQALRCSSAYVLSYEPFDAQGNLIGFTVDLGSYGGMGWLGVETVSSFRAIPASQVAAAAARISQR